MTNIDQFESVFRAAAKTPFAYQRVEIRRILLVSDLDPDEAETYESLTRRFLRVLSAQEPKYESIKNDQYEGVFNLLRQVEAFQPDLIVTYRNLRTPVHEHPYSLGTHVDVLTQAMSSPVLLMPHPLADHEGRDPWGGTSHVMVITDHLAGDHHLVNVAVALTLQNGRLTLTHVEDQQVFDRYMHVIERIPEIESEGARDAIHQQLLKEPHDYVTSCRHGLQAQEMPTAIEEVIAMGHHLSEYKRLVDEHDVNLLVMNTKDEDQLAMHGLAYPLAVELRQIPLFLL